MKNSKLSFFPATLLFVLLSFSLQVLGISPELEATVHYETKANAVSVRTDEKLAIENYEIPYRLVARDVALRIDKKILDSLLFQKNGETYIRWMINPEDSRWHKDVEKFLKENGVSTEHHRHFEAYQTASRSYIVVDPDTKAEFSVKVSTDKTGGAWRDKKQTYEDAWQIRMVTDFVFDQTNKTGTMENAILLDEPAIFGLEKIDQGMVIREYGKLAKSGHTYVPGFSVMHETTGRELAKLNGSNDPAAYWNEHYNKPLARALAEFAAMTGMTYDSPHSQNFLVELDENKKPTGKIVLRDFGDTYLNSDFFKAIGRPDIPKRWELPNVKEGYFSVAVGILHGNIPPSWMNVTDNSTSPSSYDQWGREFFDAYRTEFRRQTGVDLPSQEKFPVRDGMYMHNNFKVSGTVGAKFLDLVKAGHQRENLRYGQCRYLFAM